MSLLYVRPWDKKDKCYLVRPDFLAAFLQGQNFMDIGIIVHEVPGWLIEHLVQAWPDDRYFELLSKPIPATKDTLDEMSL